MMVEENEKSARDGCRGTMEAGGIADTNRQHVVFRNVLHSASFRFLFLAYIVLGTAIIVLDLGNTFWGQLVADLGRSIIPSIKGTSEITSAPASSATVLTLAWLWGGVVMYATIAWILFKTSCCVVNWEHWKLQPVVSKIIACIVGPTFILGLANAAPTNSAGIGGRVFNLLATAPICTIFWGIIIWISVLAGLFISTIGLISLRKMNIVIDHES
jgi:hypothetical protein